MSHELSKFILIANKLEKLTRVSNEIAKLIRVSEEFCSVVSSVKKFSFIESDMRQNKVICVGKSVIFYLIKISLFIHDYLLDFVLPPAKILKFVVVIFIPSCFTSRRNKFYKIPNRSDFALHYCK